MNKKNSITTIFFDLFGVLLGVDQSVIIHYLSQFTDLSYIETRGIVLGEPFMRLERAEIGFSEYLDEITSAMKNGDRIDKIILKDMWMGSKVGEMPTVSLFERLKSKYRIWIISNTSESHINKLRLKFEFLTLVDGVVTSERAGAHKPNPIIFQFALSESGANIKSSVFIDDNHANVASAENMGFQVHHYVDYEKLICFLKHFY